MLEVMLVLIQEHVKIAETTLNRKKEVNLPFFRVDELYNLLLIFH